MPGPTDDRARARRSRRAGCRHWTGRFARPPATRRREAGARGRSVASAILSRQPPTITVSEKLRGARRDGGEDDRDRDAERERRDQDRKQSVVERALIIMRRDSKAGGGGRSSEHARLGGSRPSSNPSTVP